MGMGNQELLQGLFEPETASSNPDDVQPIIKDAEPATPPAKPDVPKGVFTSDDGEDPQPISTAEEFLERFNEEKKKGAIETVNNFIGQFGEDYQEAFEAIFVKGVNPKEYFGTYNEIVSFAEMDLSDEGNQTKIIKQALADQGFDPEDIEQKLKDLKTMVTLNSSN
ncbi:hypothetical protein GHT06_007445 [Daphnia sinensis]|uniref:Uncharacterized protein n=1 Tax=Daphnia sinensis TaxID=1820382 RepID=A0AAD5PNR9_9CRUS|nr:hypothetical protein GHT06_007445 [Daphnia sinensis]